MFCVLSEESLGCSHLNLIYYITFVCAQDKVTPVTPNKAWCLKIPEKVFENLKHVVKQCCQTGQFENCGKCQNRKIQMRHFD